MGELHYKSRHRIREDIKSIPLLDAGSRSNDLTVKKVENLINMGLVTRENGRHVIIALKNNDRNQALNSIKQLLTSNDSTNINEGIELAKVCKATELIPMLRELCKSPVHTDKARFTIKQLTA